MPRLTSHSLEISIQILLQVFQQLNHLHLSPLRIGFLEHLRHLPVAHLDKHQLYQEQQRSLLLTFCPLMNQKSPKKSYQQSLVFIQIRNLPSLKLGITSVQLFQGTLEKKTTTTTTTELNFVSWSHFIMSKLLNAALNTRIKVNEELNLSRWTFCYPLYIFGSFDCLCRLNYCLTPINL